MAPQGPNDTANRRIGGKPQIEVPGKDDAKEREYESPPADEHEQIALLGEAVGLDAYGGGEEKQQHRHQGEPDPAAPEQANQRPTGLADRIGEQQRRGAGQEIPHHQAAEGAFGQAAFQRDLHGIGVKDGGVDEQERYEHEFDDARHRARGEFRLMRLRKRLGEAPRRKRKPAHRRHETERDGPDVVV
jgi:hypothetical protein